jgi:hypothetical protein
MLPLLAKPPTGQRLPCRAQNIGAANIDRALIGLGSVLIQGKAVCLRRRR